MQFVAHPLLAKAVPSIKDPGRIDLDGLGLANKVSLTLPCISAYFIETLIPEKYFILTGAG